MYQKGYGVKYIGWYEARQTDGWKVQKWKKVNETHEADISDLEAEGEEREVDACV